MDVGPLSSPDVREIAAHLTKEERREAALIGLLWGVWVTAAAFGNMFLIRSFPAPGNWIVASVITALFIVSVPPMLRMQRRFLCSTAWAKARGYDAGRIKLFSFSRKNLRLVLIFAAMAAIGIFAIDQLFMHMSGLTELTQSLKEEVAGPGMMSSIEFHFRVFEADAAAVDQLIPANQRLPGVQAGAPEPNPAESVGGGRSVGSFTVTTHGGTYTDSQQAEIASSTLDELLTGIGEKPGMLVDRTQTVSLDWWRPGMVDGWAYTRSSEVNGGGNGNILLGFRRRNGRREIRVEGTVGHSLDLSGKGANENLRSKILYEGPVARGDAIVFLAPFFRKDDSAHYLVIAYEIGKPNGAATRSGDQKPSSAPGRELHGAPFVARLKEGSVELMAVGNMPWGDTNCWLPDGAPSRRPFPTDGVGMSGSAPDANMVEKKIAFRIHNENSNGPISMAVCRFDKESGIPGGSSTLMPAYSRSPDAMFYQTIICPTNTRTMSVSLGVANGPWETVGTLEHASNSISGEGNFFPPKEGNWRASYNSVGGTRGDVAVSFSYPKREDWETRMVYISADRKLTPAQGNASQVTDNQISTVMLLSSNEYARIREFQVQRRRYQWVEFRHVSLQPGCKTTVVAEDSGDEPEKPAGAQNLSSATSIQREEKPVSATTARKGDVAESVLALGTVESSNYVSFAIPENYCQEVIRKFDAHQALTVEAFDRQGEKFGHGSLTGVDNQIDTTAGTLKCRASLVPEGENLMVRGLFVSIRMFLQVKHGVTLVPVQAVLDYSEGVFVWMIKPDQTVSRRKVQTGTSDGEMIGVESGLSAGEIVITTPPGKNLREGQKIRYELIPAGTAPPDSSSTADSSGPADSTTMRKVYELVVAGKVDLAIAELKKPAPTAVPIFRKCSATWNRCNDWLPRTRGSLARSSSACSSGKTPNGAR